MPNHFCCLLELEVDDHHVKCPTADLKRSKFYFVKSFYSKTALLHFLWLSSSKLALIPDILEMQEFSLSISCGTPPGSIGNIIIWVELATTCYQASAGCQPRKQKCPGVTCQTAKALLAVVFWALCSMAGKQSGAECQRAYVERIKSDPQQHEEYKKRRAAQDREGRKRRRENASDAELGQRRIERERGIERERERERKRLQREKKAKLLKVQISTPDNRS